MYIWSSVHECFAAAGSIALQKLVSNNSSSTIEIARRVLRVPSLC